MIKLYAVRLIGTELYLTNKDHLQPIFGKKARLFKEKEIVRFLRRTYQNTPTEETLPSEWEVVEYIPFEHSRRNSTEFLTTKTKSPLIKI